MTRRTDIEAAPEQVWEVLEDVTLLPNLSPSTTEVVVDGPLVEVDQQFDQTVRLAGRSFTSTWTVLEIEPRRRLVIEGSVAPGTRYRMTEDLEALPERNGADGTRLTLTMDYTLPFGPLGRLAGRLGAESRALDEAEHVLDGVRAVAERRVAGRGRDSA